MFKRIFVIVLDGVGIGYLPDAERVGDKGANTMKNIALASNGLSLPNLQRLGLGNIIEIKGIQKTAGIGSFGKMAEKNPAKNSDAGHWELMGYIKDPGFPLYPNGFPKQLLKRFEILTGRKVLGNIRASGTEIIKRLGEEHLKTGKLIVYTSADSVFQIAAHVDIISIEELYGICKKARKLCVGKWEVGRIIARPFQGKADKFQRINERRRDYPLPFKEDTILDKLKENGYDTITFGEVGELFNMKGITKYLHTKDNQQSINFIIQKTQKDFTGILFGNLVDFDMLYGHRRNPAGFKKALEYFDSRLSDIMARLDQDDLLVITADHGNDPTFKGTDHTREYVPLLVYGKKCRPNVNLGTRKSFADVGKTIADNFNLKINNGTSFLKEILEC
ncbi:phosphopentomutase [Candidatus Woesearchaeota archaeon]|nr:phosphopentomutase [Candidatus Woesearchaeota archaeon]